MSVLRLWILKILDGLLTLLGEIIIFFGIYAFSSPQGIRLLVFGLFLMVLGQAAGINAIRYEDRKKLRFFAGEMLENMGRQFAYPLLLFILYLVDRSGLFLALAFALTLIAVVKSLVIFFKAKMIEGFIS